MRRARVMAPVLAVALGLGAMAAPVAGASAHAKVHHAKVRHARSAEIKAKAPDLKAELLSLSDLPAGWSVTHKPSTTSTEPACLAKTKKPAGSTAKATVSYVTGTSVPAMIEDLAYFPKGAKRSMVTFARDLDSCGPISFTSGGTLLTGTIGAMSFPAIASQSAAWLMALTGTSGGISVTVGADIVTFRTGDTVGVIVYENLGSPQVTTVENYARQAAAMAGKKVTVKRKLSTPIPKKPTKAVPTTTSTSGAPPAAAVTIAPVMGGTAKPTLSAGAAGKLDVIFTGTPEATRATVVPFIVWNGTSQAVSTVDVAGSASVNGSIVGSGSSQDVEPADVAPGQAAFGKVYFGHAVPSGAAVSLSATSKSGTSNYYANVQVTQANYVAGNTTGTLPTVAGAVTNTGSATVDYPISVGIYCFTGSALTAVTETFVSGTANLAPGASGSFSTSVTASCTTFLVGASGPVASG